MTAVATSGLTALDQFCGAGGTSDGAKAAGVEVKVAINHWDRAIATHAENFPGVEHDCADVASVIPERYPTTDLLLTSPECKAHSYARGRPKDDLTLFDPDKGAERSRATMWDVPRFAEVHNYKAIITENVVPAVKWGHPKGYRGMNPGPLFLSWLSTMEALGYKWKVVSLNSMVVGAPQSRDRIYVVFWKKGQKAPDLEITAAGWCAECEGVVDGVQTWKQPDRPILFGCLNQQYYYGCPKCANKITIAVTPAAAAIDWSIEAPLIKDRDTPLAAATIGRLERGLEHLKDAPQLVPLDHLPKVGEKDTKILRSVREAFATVTTRNDVALATAPPGLVSSCGGPERKATTLAEPMNTVLTRDTSGVCVAPQSLAGIVPLRGENRVKPVGEPMDTVCASGNHHGLVVRSYGSPDGPIGKQGWQRDASSEPFGTVTAQNGYQFMAVPKGAIMPYNRTAKMTDVAEPGPTVTTVDPHALVVNEPKVEDCGFRMVQPHELAAAMAFREDYIILGNKREKVRQAGNAVTPPAATELVGRVVKSLT